MEAREEVEIERVDDRITHELLITRFDQTSRRKCRVPKIQRVPRKNSRDLQIILMEENYLISFINNMKIRRYWLTNPTPRFLT